MVQLMLREYRHARRLLLAGNSVDAVAAELGGRFTAAELVSQMNELSARRRKIQTESKRRRRQQAVKPPRIYRAQVTHSDKYKIPPHVIEERDQRLNAPDTLNSLILGDPVVPRWQSNDDSPSQNRRYGLGSISGC